MEFVFTTKSAIVHVHSSSNKGGANLLEYFNNFNQSEALLYLRRVAYKIS
jgi:hypothetical protein